MTYLPDGYMWKDILKSQEVYAEMINSSIDSIQLVENVVKVTDQKVKSIEGAA